jgi:high-affinity K+ transport system ATPase subunit B
LHYTETGTRDGPFLIIHEEGTGRSTTTSIVKSGRRDYCETRREMGIKIIMVTGANKLTALAITADVAVGDVVA